MPNFYSYENELVFTLPQKIQDNIIDFLNQIHRIADEYWTKAFYAENESSKKYCLEKYHYFTDKENTIIRTLNIMEIYPIIGWAGHHDSYFFPTTEDCDIQDDWYWNCGEYN